MTIGKKLYVNFGIILTMVMVLFLVNWFAVQREHAAKAAAASSLELADATNAVRFQMMQNRLYLSNYLLSGDTREVERMNEGLRILNEKLEQGKVLTTSVLGQGLRAAADRQAQRRGLGQCHGGGAADLLPPERRFFVGEELHGRAGSGGRGEPKTSGSPAQVG